MRQVDVGGERPYRISIGDGLLDDGAAVAAHVRGRHVFVVSDTHVGPLYARALADAVQARRPEARVIVSCIPAGETAKTLDRFSELLRELADFGATRDACVVALGGGVVGAGVDFAGVERFAGVLGGGEGGGAGGADGASGLADNVGAEHCAWFVYGCVI